MGAIPRYGENPPLANAIVAMECAIHFVGKESPVKHWASAAMKECARIGPGFTDDCGGLPGIKKAIEWTRRARQPRACREIITLEWPDLAAIEASDFVCPEMHERTIRISQSRLEWINLCHYPNIISLMYRDREQKLWAGSTRVYCIAKHLELAEPDSLVAVFVYAKDQVITMGLDPISIHQPHLIRASS